MQQSYCPLQITCALNGINTPNRVCHLHCLCPRGHPCIMHGSMCNMYWSILSKVLEKVVMNQLNSHIYSSSTYNQCQSAYRKFHPTETALLRIHNNILASMDAGGKVTALTLLNIHTAFDTIDHTSLLRRLDSGLLRKHSTGLNPI